MSTAVSILSSLPRTLSEMDSPFFLVYGAVMILLIVYAPVLSRDIRMRADSFLGRILGLLLVYGASEYLGWIYGLLTAVAFVMIMDASREGFTAAQPTKEQTREGFDGGGSVTEKKRVGKRWFVERILGEHPTTISTDRVQTAAIQGA